MNLAMEGAAERPDLLRVLDVGARIDEADTAALRSAWDAWLHETDDGPLTDDGQPEFP